MGYIHRKVKSSKETTVYEMFIPGFLACSRLSERRKNNQFKSGYEISRVKDAKQIARKAGNSSFRQA